MYRQTVVIEELDPKGAVRGFYREVREVIFTPEGKRIEQLRGKPFSSLHRLILTEEDFRDIREVQPLLLTEDKLWLYEFKLRGEEEIDGRSCHVLMIRPRQILEGQRLFEGLLWVEKETYATIRMAGQAVPQIHSKRRENLFPHFTTVRWLIDGVHWFPILTHGDDTLEFSTGGQRIRLRIEYADYKRFTAESEVKYEGR